MSLKIFVVVIVYDLKSVGALKIEFVAPSIYYYRSYNFFFIRVYDL